MSNPNEKVASIRAKLKFPNVASFVERYAPNVSTAGIFVKTPTPKPVGTRVKFEFLIADGTAVMRGLGQVAWVRDTDVDDRPVGMGIKFVKLDAASREVLDRIIDFKHSLGGPPTPSRYSEVPPPYVPEGIDVDEAEAEGAPAAAVEEPPRETPPPAPPPKPAIAPPPAPAAPAEEPPRAEIAPKKKHRPKSAAMDMSAIDSMLADLAAPPVDTGRKRRKAAEPEFEARPPVPAPAVPVPAPAQPPAPAPETTAPAPSPVFQIPALTRPSAAELEAAELDLESELTEARSSEDEVREELREELEELEGPPPVVLREPPATEGARATGAIRNLIANELESGDLVDMLEPDEPQDHLGALSEPPGSAGEADDGAPIRFTPGSLVSFMPPPPSEADSLDEDFESVLGGADASGDGEVSSPTAALEEDSGVTELGEDAVIAGVMDDDSPEAQGDFEIIEEADQNGEIAADGGSGDMVDSLIAEMARDSHEPAGPADLQLLEEEVVSDALDDLFDEAGDEELAASRAAANAPDTLPDDAVPPGLVRDRAAKRPAPPPPPDDEDAASKKKGFFGKLFGK